MNNNIFVYNNNNNCCCYNCRVLGSVCVKDYISSRITGSTTSWYTVLTT